MTIEGYVNANEQVMVLGALQYGQYVEILKPKKSREQVKNSIAEIVGRYK